MSPQDELVKMWLDRARMDIRSAQVDLSAQPPIIEDACFHCQQAVEKILKGFLTFQEIEFEKTHSIRYLIELCARKDPSFEILSESAVPLTKFATLLRYPFVGPPPTLNQARNAVEVVRTVWQFVVPKLPEESTPAL
jgi:HEPN domain-containing protein